MLKNKRGQVDWPKLKSMMNMVKETKVTCKSFDPLESKPDYILCQCFSNLAHDFP